MTTDDRPYAVTLDELERGTRVPREAQVTEAAHEPSAKAEEEAEAFPQLSRPWSLS